MAKVGDIIDGKYEILTEIGRGGMSVVYLARDRRLNKQWAIKEAKKNPGANSAIFEMTPIAEANLLKSLEHPNIVRIVDIIEYNNLIYIVEDFVEGNSLNEEVKRGPSSPKDVIRWGKQLCDVFTYLHSRNPKIIYRDMKPANVQLSPDRKTVKLLDFGIAKTYKPQKVGDTTNLGTRGYAAPEQFDAKIQSDERTDIFSLGVTLRSLLMGKTPFDVDFYGDMRRFNPYVTDGLVRVIEKATNPEPAKRFKTAAEFKQALVHYHDYDAKVIASRKKKLNQFRGVFISSIACLCIGLVLLPTAFLVRKSIGDRDIKSTNINTKIKVINDNPGNLDYYLYFLSYLAKDGLDVEELDYFKESKSNSFKRMDALGNQRSELNANIIFQILTADKGKGDKEKLEEIKNFDTFEDKDDKYYDLGQLFKKISSYADLSADETDSQTSVISTLEQVRSLINTVCESYAIKEIENRFKEDGFNGSFQSRLERFAMNNFLELGMEEGVMESFINNENVKEYASKLHEICSEKSESEYESLIKNRIKAN